LLGVLWVELIADIHELRSTSIGPRDRARSCGM